MFFRAVESSGSVGRWSVRYPKVAHTEGGGVLLTRNRAGKLAGGTGDKLMPERSEKTVSGGCV